MKLDDIGRRHGSDKSSLVHNFLDHYEGVLQEFADRPITLLEFGSGDHAAIATWLEFFPRAAIVGVFPDQDARAFARERVTIEIGNQGDASFLRHLIGTYAPDVVIDDGWHLWDMQILALRHLFPALRPGGVYIVQALQTSFGAEHEKLYRGGAEVSAFAYIQSLLPGVTGGAEFASPGDTFARHFAAETASVTLSAKNCIIRKKLHAERGLLQVIPLERSGAEVATVEETQSYRRSEPVIVDAPAWHVSNVAEQLALEPVHTIPGQVARFMTATVFWPGMIRTSSGQVIEETTEKLLPFLDRFGFHRIGETDLMTPERDTEPTRFAFTDAHVLLMRLWDGNYGHWLVECLPLIERVAAVQNLAVCKFVVPAWPHMQQVYRDSLALFDIPPERIVVAGYDAWFFEELIYPLPITRTPWLIGPAAVRTLEQLGARALARSNLPVGPEKIYVSRNRTPQRRLRNEDEIAGVLTRLGYEIVYPEELSFDEQIARFSGARYVVGNLGAALTNLVFAPRSVRLLALTTELMPDDFYWDLMAQKSGTYLSLHGRATDPDLGMQSDFEIGLDRFTELLLQLESD